MTSANEVNMSLNHAIRIAAAQNSNPKAFSRKSPLTFETLIRFLIGAEGGSLDKILHTAGIEVTAVSYTHLDVYKRQR